MGFKHGTLKIGTGNTKVYTGFDKLCQIEMRMFSAAYLFLA